LHAHNREYKTIIGSYKGVHVFVTSTGIGGVSAGIAIEELKNVDLKVMIRIGSCGALQEICVLATWSMLPVR
jgi:uridine phosphorylase